MPIFRKRLDVVEEQFEACQLTSETAADLETWTEGQLVELIGDADPNSKYISLYIPTPEGTVRVNQGDYIIQGQPGVFHKIQGEAFEGSYESVPEPEPLLPVVDLPPTTESTSNGS